MPALSLENKIEILKKVKIFADTEDSVLRYIAADLVEQQAVKGKIIIRKGTVGDAMFILAEGSVRIHDGDHVLARLEKGEVFGEYSLIDKDERSASVTAETDCLLLTLSQSDFYRIAIQNNEVIRGVLKVLIRRIRDMNILEEKLSKSFLKIRKQKDQIESMSKNIQEQKVQLEQQNYDLSKLNEEKNRLIGILVHQIKNPLTSSLCLAEMLSSDERKLDKTQRELVEVIYKSLKRIHNLVNENLDVNVIDSKVYHLKIEKLNLKKIVEELIESYSYFMEQKQVRIKADLEEAEADLNRVYFTQIVDNILSNAVQFTRPGSSISVSLGRHKNNIRVEITDQGYGIPEDELHNIFHIYKRQTDMAKQSYYPKGLGLAIAYRYTHELGGKITCESKLNEGSSFTVVLPISRKKV